MLNVAICDDENRTVNQIEQMIQGTCRKENISITIDVFYSFKTLKAKVLAGEIYDILYLNISQRLLLNYMLL